MARHSASGLSPITVSTSELLEIVKTNRDKHRGIFEEALIIYRKKAIAELDSIIKKLESGKTPSLYINLPVPEEHTDDYTRAIKMLGMHNGPTIELDEQAYMRLVDDEWGWSDLFTANTIGYVSNNYA